MKILSTQTEINPLLFAPWVTHGCWRKDWLHVSDQGVAPDMLGNILYMLMYKMQGRSQAQKCKALWLRLQEFYIANDVEDKLDQLLPTMIKAPGSWFLE